MILCWAASIAILSHMQPAGHALDAPGLNEGLKTIKPLEENTGSKHLNISHSNIFSEHLLLCLRETNINKQMGLHQTKKFLHSKGNYQQNEKMTY